MQPWDRLRIRRIRHKWLGKRSPMQTARECLPALQLLIFSPAQRCVTLILLFEPVWAMPIEWPEPTCVTVAEL